MRNHSRLIVAAPALLLSCTLALGQGVYHPVTALQDARDRFAQDTGLSVGLGVTSVFQMASNTVEPQRNLWSFSYDFYGEWAAFDDEAWGRGTLGWLVEGGRPIGHRRNEDLSANIGSVMGVNDDLLAEDILVSELWWSHGLGPIVGDEHRFFTLSLGKIDQTNTFDTNRIANDETAQFLSSALVNNPSIAFPDNGLGLNAVLRPTEQAYLAFGVSDGNADVRETSFRTLGKGDLFHIGEGGVTVMLDGVGEGHYRLLAWHARVDSDSLDDQGVAISFDQAVGDEGLVIFLRGGVSDGDLATFDRFISMGVGAENPFGREGDLAAVGVAYGRPGDRNLREETIIEAFYRAQVTSWLAVTPDAQLIVRPAEGDRSTVGVLGLRVQATF
jgi:porin